MYFIIIFMLQRISENHYSDAKLRRETPRSAFSHMAADGYLIDTNPRL